MYDHPSYLRDLYIMCIYIYMHTTPIVGEIRNDASGTMREIYIYSIYIERERESERERVRERERERERETNRHSKRPQKH